MSFDFNFKVVLIGSPRVGKTSLIIKYIDGIYEAFRPTTVGVDFKYKDLKIDNKKVRLEIWDTAGEEQYRNPLTSSIYKNTDIAIIVFDLTVEGTLKEVDYYIKEIENKCRTEPLIVIAGNKCDLIEDQIENIEEKIKEILKGKELRFFKTSAKDGTNVNELFYGIAKELKEKNEVNKHLHHKKINTGLDQNENNLSQSKVIKNSDLIQIKQKKQGCC
ncbi:ras-related protein rab-37 [Anaeramoeba ignava]|uniref:Ras-related protein rab-37 n=1 Tax=Anaeramoeba ignava TaxID=1746090 RepID=A0A9Q0LP87_ANAIG|nr:ras-related protein rab-37 [Anaeramoeba ignava]